MRRYHLYVFVGILSLALVAAGVMMAFAQPNFAKVKEYRIERSVPPEAQACIVCHQTTTPGVFADWAAAGWEAITANDAKRMTAGKSLIMVAPSTALIGCRLQYLYISRTIYRDASDCHFTIR